MMRPFMHRLPCVPTTVLALAALSACGRPATQTTLEVDVAADAVSDGDYLFYRVAADAESGGPRAFDAHPIALGREPAVGEVGLPQRLPFVPAGGDASERAVVQIGVMSGPPGTGAALRASESRVLAFVEHTHVEQQLALGAPRCLVEYVCCRDGAPAPVEQATYCAPLICQGGTPVDACVGLDQEYTCVGDRLCVPVGECTDGQTMACGDGVFSAESCTGTVACVDGRWGTECALPPPEPEGCATLLDEDCDGLVDEADCECVEPECESYDLADGLRANVVDGAGDALWAAQAGNLGWWFHFDDPGWSEPPPPAPRPDPLPGGAVTMFGVRGSLDGRPAFADRFHLMQEARQAADQIGWMSVNGGENLRTRGFVFVGDFLEGGESRDGDAIRAHPENSRQIAIEWRAPATGGVSLDVEVTVGNAMGDVEWHVLLRRGGVTSELEWLYVSREGGPDQVAVSPAETVASPPTDPRHLGGFAHLRAGDSVFFYARVGDHDAGDGTRIRGTVWFRPD